MACSVVFPLGVVTGLGFTDPPCVDTEPLYALAGGKASRVRNPLTGRLVRADTPLGQKILATPPGKIYNPTTGRYVKHDGKKGKELLRRKP